jgi:hypothetical protein
VTVVRRAALAAAVAAAAVLGVATPAFAATVSGGFTSPAEGETFAAPPTITGSFHWEQGIESIALALTGDSGQPGASVSGTCANPPDGVTCTDGGRTADVSWSPTLTYNGHYTVKATVSGKAGQNAAPQPARVSRTFALQAPPEPPRNVIVDVSDDRSVVIAWRANTEPDMLGYIVYRGYDGGSPRAVGQVPHGTRANYSYNDTGTTEAGGSYQYQVVAIRDDGSGGPVPSEPSSEASADVPEPPPTTTTTEVPPSTTTPGGDTTATTRAGSSTSPTTPRGGSVDLSQFGSLVNRGQLPSQPPPTIPDTGFDPTLDYGDPQDTLPDEEELPEEPDLALPQVISDGVDGRRPTLVLVASGLALFVFAMHLRVLARRTAAIPEQLPLEP